MGHFRFNHPELGQMTAGFAFLGAKGRAETVDLAETHRRTFQIELAGLGQVQGLTKIVHLKECLLAFAGDRRKDRGIDKRETIVI
jgi:hypothetical protein